MNSSVTEYSRTKSLVYWKNAFSFGALNSSNNGSFLHQRPGLMYRLIFWSAHIVLSRLYSAKNKFYVNSLIDKLIVTSHLGYGAIFIFFSYILYMMIIHEISTSVIVTWHLDLYNVTEQSNIFFNQTNRVLRELTLKTEALPLFQTLLAKRSPVWANLVRKNGITLLKNPGYIIFPCFSGWLQVLKVTVWNPLMIFPGANYSLLFFDLWVNYGMLTRFFASTSFRMHIHNCKSLNLICEFLAA